MKTVNMSEKKEAKELTGKQKRFCEEYIFDFNGTRAYKAAYPDIRNDDTARTNASRLLTIANIKAYIDSIQADLEKTSGISRLMVLREHQKLAFSSIAHLHNTWIERKEFENLTPEQKDCIAEISTQLKTTRNSDGTLEENEYVKVKLYDKQKALDSISKMLGFDAPDKIEHNINGLKSFKIIGAAGKGNSGK